MSVLVRIRVAYEMGLNLGYDNHEHGAAMKSIDSHASKPAKTNAAAHLRSIFTRSTGKSTLGFKAVLFTQLAHVSTGSYITITITIIPTTRPHPVASKRPHGK